jgi:hypothetical protein
MMNKLLPLTFGLLGVAVIALFLSRAPVVQADEIVCTGSLGAVVVDDVRVPDNATCTLNGTRVEGTVKVERNATLYANGARIDGSVQAENAARVNVGANSTVGGSIQVVQSGAAAIDRVAVNGDIQFESNKQGLSATNNQVGGNVQAFQNTSGVTIANNIIDGNLQCKENTPPPTGGNNVVMGSAEDQCANMQSTPPTPTPTPSAPTPTPPPTNLPYKFYLPFVKG